MTAAPNPPSPSTFVRLLDGLDRAAFGRFVADLWTLRGHEARFDGDVIRVSNGNDSTDRVVPFCHGDRSGPSRSDPPADVAPGPGPSGSSGW